MEWDKFAGTQPYGFVVHTYPDTGENVVYAKVDREPPALLSVIVGDILHNLRSALDHLAWQLVQFAGAKPGFHTKFPIHDTEKSWVREIEHRRRSGDRPSPLQGVDPTHRVWTFIEGIQPYHGGECADALTNLRALSNADKHRALLLSGGVTNPEEIAAVLHWNPEAVLISQSIELKPGQPLKDHTPVARLLFDPTKPDPQMNVYGGLTCVIAFADKALGGADPVPLDGLIACVQKHITAARSIVDQP